MIRAIIFTVILACASAGIVDVEDCGSDAVILKVEVTNCTTQPCILVKGRTYDIIVDFIPGNDTSLLDLDIAARFTIIDTPIVVPENGNGCPGLSTDCPVAKGVFQRHKHSMTISGAFFEFEAIITYKLINDDQNDQVCVRARVMIAPPDLQ